MSENKGINQYFTDKHIALIQKGITKAIKNFDFDEWIANYLDKEFDSLYENATISRFLEDEIKGLYSYEALKQRLIGNPFAVYEKKDLSRPVILLEKLTKEELFQLFKNIRNVFAEYDETKYLVTNNEIEKFMQYLFNRFEANSFLTSRESIRQFIGLLTQIQNNPNIKFNTNKILYFEISRLRGN